MQNNDLVMSQIAVVRSADQKYGDFNVEVQPDWDVQALKRYLSEFHPANPVVNKQRLIFAGQLMKDNFPVFNYLNRLGSSDSKTHAVIHLVCSQIVAPSHNFSNEGLRKRHNNQNTVSSSIEGRLTDLSAAGQSNVSSETVQNFGMASIAVPQSTPNLLGHATVGFPALSPQDAQHYLAQTPASGFYYPYMMQVHHPASPFSMDQYYQYLQQIYGLGISGSNFYWPMMGPTVSGAAISPNVMTNGSNFSPQPAVNNNVQDNMEAGQMPPAPRVDLQAGPGEENGENGRRDWLDWAYLIFRCSLLFLILFSYASLERVFFIVVVCGVLIAHRNGWFSRRNIGQQHEENNNQQHVTPQNDANNNSIDELDAEQHAEGNGEHQTFNFHQNEVESNAATPWNIFWSTCYTFFSSFFSSLVPEQPPPANF